MTQKWCMWMDIRGDLRFLSHAQTMRTVIQTAVRAKVPLKYTEGYNPRPVVSLVCPRPVGVASRCDLAVMSLNEPAEADELLDRMNRNAPIGMKFTSAKKFSRKRAPQPLAADYELSVDEKKANYVKNAVGDLGDRDQWNVERIVSGKGSRKRKKTRRIDLKDMVKDLKVTDNRLRMTLAPRGDLWPRPAEVLRLLGMDERVDLAAMVRTGIQYDI